MPRKESLNREILALAWPAIASNITTPLLSLVDVAVVGHIGSAVYIGAIAVGGAMFNMLYWLFGFLRAGTSGMTAQAYGAQKLDEAVRTLARSLFTAVIVGVLLIALSRPLGSVVLRFMDADGETQALAWRYFSTAIWGAPGVLVTFALSGWFLGMQSSRPAMWMAIVANSLNIVLCLLFVFVANMSVVGVGLATAVAQWVSAITGLVMLYGRLKKINYSGWRTGIFNIKALGHLFSVNLDIMLRTLCLIAVTLWFTHSGAVSGAEILAANALLMQLFMLFSYFMDGFAYAGEALGGRFYGSNDTTQLNLMVRKLMRWGFLLSLVGATVYFVGGDFILGLLTDQANVLQVAHDYRLWAVLVPLCGFASFLWDGVYIGITRTRLMLVTMLCSMGVFFALYFWLYQYLGNHALWLAFVAYLLTRGVVQTILYPKARRPRD